MAKRLRWWCTEILFVEWGGAAPPATQEPTGRPSVAAGTDGGPPGSPLRGRRRARAEWGEGWGGRGTVGMVTEGMAVRLASGARRGADRNPVRRDAGPAPGAVARRPAAATDIFRRLGNEREVSSEGRGLCRLLE